MSADGWLPDIYNKEYLDGRGPCMAGCLARLMSSAAVSPASSASKGGGSATWTAAMLAGLASSWLLR